jgi:hypothetical protein
MKNLIIFIILFFHLKSYAQQNLKYEVYLDAGISYIVKASPYGSLPPKFGAIPFNFMAFYNFNKYKIGIGIICGFYNNNYGSRLIPSFENYLHRELANPQPLYYGITSKYNFKLINQDIKLGINLCYNSFNIVQTRASFQYTDPNLSYTSEEDSLCKIQNKKGIGFMLEPYIIYTTTKNLNWFGQDDNLRLFFKLSYSYRQEDMSIYYKRKFSNGIIKEDNFINPIKMSAVHFGIGLSKGF